MRIETLNDVQIVRRIGTTEPCEVMGYGPAKACVSRRQLLRVGLATGVLLVIGGCTSFRGSGSDLEKAHRDLQGTLEGIAKDDEQQTELASIARRIEYRCRELTQEHDKFRERFNELSRQRETSSAELSALVEGFSERRTQQRDALLHLQDELRLALTQAEWSEAVYALKKIKSARSRPPAGGA
jgi:hypothetical protein